MGAHVILIDGQLAAYLGRSRQLFVYLPDAEPDRSRVARALAARLADVARTGDGREGGLLIGEIDGLPAGEHPMTPFLIDAGFALSALGFQIRRERPRHSARPAPATTAGTDRMTEATPDRVTDAALDADVDAATDAVTDEATDADDDSHA